MHGANMKINVCYLIIYIKLALPPEWGHAFRSGTALQAGSWLVRFPEVSLEFFIDIILPAALWPWGRFSLGTEMSTRNISCSVKVAGA